MTTRTVTIAAGALLLLALGCSSTGEEADATEGERSPAAREGIGALTQHVETLDPDAYRVEIEILEAAVFQSADPTPAQREMIAGALSDLAERVVEERTVLARALGAELLELSERAAHGQDHASVTRRWTRIRHGLFGTAPWFEAGVETASR